MMQVVQWFDGEPQTLGHPLRELPEVRVQRRKRQATQSMPEWKICGADTETVHGCVWLFSTEKGCYEIEKFRDLIEVMFDRDHGRKWKKSKASKKGCKRGRSSLEFFFYNLKFDSQAVMKLLSDRAISALLAKEDEGGRDSKVVINADSGDFDPKVKGSMVELEYLEGKLFRMKPIDWFVGQYKLGLVNWWDISQFYYRIKLQTAAEKYLGRSKVEKCFDGSTLDASRFDEPDYRDLYREDIERYAVVDAELAGALARKTRADFLEHGIRFIQPYSAANVAQRALLDTCSIPTINDSREDPHEMLRMQKALTAYHGGWFETRGSGYMPDCTCVDLASAYPYVMYHLQDPSKGTWIEGDREEEWWEWVDKREPFTIGFAEASILFEPGLAWHPLVQKADTGTLVSPRFVRGWFTADELAEAKKWPHVDVVVGEWFYHHDPEPVYPFRRFIEKFYKIKMECADDPVAYRVAKTALNSIYGKTIQAVDGKTGKLWNPYYAATITGATRARLAEFTRSNGYASVSLATDGIIIPSESLEFIPNRPLPAPYNLGQWEIEAEGDVLVIMSGVYSVRSENEVKTTFRGSASYFVRDYRDGGLFRFCLEHAERRELRETVRKPWSAKEARIRKDYGLINVFEPRHFRMTAMGDSNKRVWTSEHPQTFGDLGESWWPSQPHSEVHLPPVRPVDYDE